ncbi:DNA topoisomerase, partial [Francisella tularensis subsp. holarctica]|uniref:DNA topoisomerase n=1 Tax=Francisella tularensis TaxID=263 RepID=UPI002381C574
VFLVGYNISRLLWRNFSSGLSAGRLQSPYLRMIVVREIESENFIKKDYCRLTAETLKQKQIYANMHEYNKNKFKQITFTTS